MNFSANVLSSEPSLSSVSFEGFLSTLVPALDNFSGLLMLPLCCVEAINPKTTVSWSMCRACFTVLLLALIVAFACCSLAPGPSGLGDDDAPLSSGYSHAFSISFHSSRGFSLLPCYVTSFCFIYSYSRLVCAMARSHLLPRFLAQTRGQRQVPYAAQIVGNVLAFCMLLLFWHSAKDIHIFVSMAFYSSMVVFMGILFSFCIFRWKYTTLAREFSSPVGIPGAVLAGFVFLLPLIHTLSYTELSHLSLIIFLSIMAVCAVYYALVANKQQAYSKEEQDIMLVVYVMKSEPFLPCFSLLDLISCTGNQLRRRTTRQPASRRHQHHSLVKRSVRLHQATPV